MRFIDHIKNHFLPHRGNNHKANALKAPVLFFYLLLFVFVQLTSPYLLKFKGDVLGFAVNIQEQQLLEYTNAERLNAGLRAVKINQELNQAAMAKAKYMFAHNFWAHNAPDGTTPWKFIEDAKYNYLFAGENLAKDFEDSKGVVDAWMASPTHRANIMQEKYQDIGFAVLNGSLNGEDTTLVVQMFGTPVSGAVPNPPEVSGANNESKNIVPVQEIQPSVSGVSVKNFVFTKEFSLYFIGFLISLLAIDGFFIWRKKIFRISSHNLAHLMLLICLFVVISFLKSGAII
jgi:hypothetical protein